MSRERRFPVTNQKRSKLSSSFPGIILRKGRDFAVRNRHPWIFSGAILRVERDLEEGDVVEVFSENGEYLGTGHAFSGSIAVKMFAYDRPSELGLEFWESRLQQALLLRNSLGLVGNKQTDAWRLVNAEGDGLPGLVIDIYGTTAVVQIHSLGMFRSLDALSSALSSLKALLITAIYDKSGETLKSETPSGYLFGKQANEPIIENGCRYFVDWEEGQKTGFFLDQRENRLLLRRFSNGRDVLNTFCYTGGFSINALMGGARSVVSVDSSKSALAILEKNLNLNSLNANHQSVQTDCFSYLTDSSEDWDLIVLDPPAFAKHKSAIKGALNGYRSLNRLALQRLRTGGILFTFSCSQLVTRDDFKECIVKAGQEVGRGVRVIHELHAAPCHPVSLFHPEGSYLKGFVLEIA